MYLLFWGIYGVPPLFGESVVYLFFWGVCGVPPLLGDLWCTPSFGGICGVPPLLGDLWCTPSFGGSMKYAFFLSYIFMSRLKLLLLEYVNVSSEDNANIMKNENIVTITSSIFYCHKKIYNKKMFVSVQQLILYTHGFFFFFELCVYFVTHRNLLVFGLRFLSNTFAVCFSLCHAHG